ncbi:GNAT family N-acetyltransferase [Bacillus sp. M6-12]|uniref:GNAT family N-acetyltransferase n=1 Tax=Bacillus sp. M6-12 TaxID=2054166 RepID=UPI000C764972|nr:GNAT family N-acetyltransferase [Bacillus sp. M6-12]PLS19246.1 GNAT family N-acetyltransferase [Bacillus sp. M6-12]
MIRFYDKKNIDEMPEPKGKNSKYVKAFFYPFVTGESTQYIENVKTKMAFLSVDDILLSVNINEEEYENSYVSSLYSHYISYAIEELYLLKQPLLEKGLTHLIKGAGHFLKGTEINKVIYVNNWLFSTNLQVDLTPTQIKRIVAFLISKFPEHMIVFRSLSDYLHPKLISSFKGNGFKELASRQVYIAKPWNQLTKKEKGSLKGDRKQIEKHGYELIEEIEPTHENIQQIHSLYNELYINKYSNYNPKFTPALYRHFLENRLLKFTGVLKDGEMVGCIGYWKLNGVMTAPILGYKVDLGNESGLYRILSNLLYQEGERQGLIGHRSAGASEFKLNRGAISSVEYSMIYNKHLPMKRRIGIGLLRLLCNQIGVKLLKNKKL